MAKADIRFKKSFGDIPRGERGKSIRILRIRRRRRRGSRIDSKWIRREIANGPPGDTPWFRNLPARLERKRAVRAAAVEVWCRNNPRPVWDVKIGEWEGKATDVKISV